MKLFPALAALFSLLAAPAALAEPSCGSHEQITHELAGTLMRAFDAVEQEQPDIWNALMTSDFTAFDGGRRFDRQGLYGIIKKAHAEGRHYKWSVTEEKSEADCAIGILYYVNKGVVTDATGPKDVTWLETAAFRREDGKWRIFFVESVRTGAPQG